HTPKDIPGPTVLSLSRELWADHRHACPYLRHDERGCFCMSSTLPEEADRYTPGRVRSSVQDHGTNASPPGYATGEGLPPSDPRIAALMGSTQARLAARSDVCGVATATQFP